jgi:hypothetical protein
VEVGTETVSTVTFMNPFKETIVINAALQATKTKADDISSFALITNNNKYELQYLQ